MKQADQQKPNSVSIDTPKQAVQWLFLAYSLGHPDACQCEYCIVSRRTVASGSLKTTAVA